jgi:hypothetical protein
MGSGRRLDLICPKAGVLRPIAATRIACTSQAPRFQIVLSRALRRPRLAAGEPAAPHVGLTKARTLM